MLLDISFSDRNVRLERKKKHRKKGIVQCESCVYYIAVMSGLNCFLIVCFYATIVFPCLSFPLCLQCNRANAISYLQGGVVERGSLLGGDLFAGEWLGFLSLSNAFVTF